MLLTLAMACTNRDTNPGQTTEDAAIATSLNTTVSDSNRTEVSTEQTLTIYAPEVKAKSGGSVCMDVLVSGFEKLLSMQYTITWNRNVLQFKELKNFQLPYLDPADFGTTRTAEGFLTVAWIEESLKGASVADGSSIYQVCFDVKGKAGESSYFKITDSPTTIEIVNLREKVIPLKKRIGKVTVE